MTRHRLCLSGSVNFGFEVCLSVEVAVLTIVALAAVENDLAVLELGYVSGQVKSVFVNRSSGGLRVTEIASRLLSVLVAAVMPESSGEGGWLARLTIETCRDS